MTKVECECPVEGHGAGCPNDRLEKRRAPKGQCVKCGAEFLVIYAPEYAGEDIRLCDGCFDSWRGE